MTRWTARAWRTGPKDAGDMLRGIGPDGEIEWESSIAGFCEANAEDRATCAQVRRLRPGRGLDAGGGAIPDIEIRRRPVAGWGGDLGIVISIEGRRAVAWPEVVDGEARSYSVLGGGRVLDLTPAELARKAEVHGETTVGAEAGRATRGLERENRGEADERSPTPRQREVLGRVGDVFTVEDLQVSACHRYTGHSRLMARGMEARGAIVALGDGRFRKTDLAVPSCVRGGSAATAKPARAKKATGAKPARAKKATGAKPARAKKTTAAKDGAKPARATKTTAAKPARATKTTAVKATKNADAAPAEKAPAKRQKRARVTKVDGLDRLVAQVPPGVPGIYGVLPPDGSEGPIAPRSPSSSKLLLPPGGKLRLRNVPAILAGLDARRWTVIVVQHGGGRGTHSQQVAAHELLMQARREGKRVERVVLLPGKGAPSVLEELAFLPPIDAPEPPRPVTFGDLDRRDAGLYLGRKGALALAKGRGGWFMLRRGLHDRLWRIMGGPMSFTVGRSAVGEGAGQTLPPAPSVGALAVPAAEPGPVGLAARARALRALNAAGHVIADGDSLDLTPIATVPLTAERIGERWRVHGIAGRSDGTDSSVADIVGRLADAHFVRGPEGDGFDSTWLGHELRVYGCSNFGPLTANLWVTDCELGRPGLMVQVRNDSGGVYWSPVGAGDTRHGPFSRASALLAHMVEHLGLQRATAATPPPPKPARAKAVTAAKAPARPAPSGGRWALLHRGRPLGWLSYRRRDARTETEAKAAARLALAGRKQRDPQRDILADNITPWQRDGWSVALLPVETVMPDETFAQLFRRFSGDVAEVRAFLERRRATGNALPVTIPAGWDAPAPAGRPTHVLIGCVKTKRASGTWPAAELYTGALWDLRRAYAEARGLPWGIVSAALGVIGPAERVKPYEQRIEEHTPERRRVWQMTAQRQLEQLFGKGAVVEVLAGKAYVEALEVPAKALGITLLTPAAGRGIGARKAWLAERIAELGGWVPTGDAIKAEMKAWKRAGRPPVYTSPSGRVRFSTHGTDRYRIERRVGAAFKEIGRRPPSFAEASRLAVELERTSRGEASAETPLQPRPASAAVPPSRPSKPTSAPIAARPSAPAKRDEPATAPGQPSLVDVGESPADLPESQQLAWKIRRAAELLGRPTRGVWVVCGREVYPLGALPEGLDVTLPAVFVDVSAAGRVDDVQADAGFLLAIEPVDRAITRERLALTEEQREALLTALRFARGEGTRSYDDHKIKTLFASGFRRERVLKAHEVWTDRQRTMSWATPKDATNAQVVDGFFDQLALDLTEGLPHAVRARARKVLTRAFRAARRHSRRQPRTFERHEVRPIPASAGPAPRSSSPASAGPAPRSSSPASAGPAPRSSSPASPAGRREGHPNPGGHGIVVQVTINDAGRRSGGIRYETFNPHGGGASGWANTIGNAVGKALVDGGLWGTDTPIVIRRERVHSSPPPEIELWSTTSAAPTDARGKALRLGHMPKPKAQPKRDDAATAGASNQAAGPASAPAKRDDPATGVRSTLPKRDDAATATGPKRDDAATTFEIVAGRHTKKKHPIWTVRIVGERVSEARFAELKALAKQVAAPNSAVATGYYSSYARGRAIPGFVFGSEMEARRFLARARSAAPAPTDPRSIDKNPEVARPPEPTEPFAGVARISAAGAAVLEVVTADMHGPERPGTVRHRRFGDGSILVAVDKLHHDQFTIARFEDDAEPGTTLRRLGPYEWIPTCEVPHGDVLVTLDGRVSDRLAQRGLARHFEDVWIPFITARLDRGALPTRRVEHYAGGGERELGLSDEETIAAVVDELRARLGSGVNVFGYRPSVGRADDVGFEGLANEGRVGAMLAKLLAYRGDGPWWLIALRGAGAPLASERSTAHKLVDAGAVTGAAIERVLLVAGDQVHDLLAGEPEAPEGGGAKPRAKRRTKAQKRRTKAQEAADRALYDKALAIAERAERAGLLDGGRRQHFISSAGRVLHGHASPNERESLEHTVERFTERVERELAKPEPAEALATDWPEAPEKPRARTIANVLAVRIAHEARRSGKRPSAEQRRQMLQYSGWGGLDIEKVRGDWPEGVPLPHERALVHEYYTPWRVCADIARAARELIDPEPASRGQRPQIRALEPSAGVGRFVHAAAFPNWHWTAVELSPLSHLILSQTARPGDETHSSSFEAFVQAHPTARFDVILSNPPYGPRGEQTVEDKDRRYRVKAAYQYFILRCLTLLRPGGVGAFLVPGGFMTGSGTGKLRRRVAESADLVGAFRLPNGLFPGARLSLDVVFLRARSGAGVEDADFLAGRYFDNHPAHVLGEVKPSGRWGDPEVIGEYEGLPPLPAPTSSSPATRSRPGPRVSGTVEKTVVIDSEMPSPLHDGRPQGLLGRALLLLDDRSVEQAFEALVADGVSPDDAAEAVGTALSHKTGVPMDIPAFADDLRARIADEPGVYPPGVGVYARNPATGEVLELAALGTLLGGYASRLKPLESNVDGMMQVLGGRGGVWDISIRVLPTDLRTRVDQLADHFRKLALRHGAQLGFVHMEHANVDDYGRYPAAEGMQLPPPSLPPASGPRTTLDAALKRAARIASRKHRFVGIWRLRDRVFAGSGTNFGIWHIEPGAMSWYTPSGQPTTEALWSVEEQNSVPEFLWHYADKVPSLRARISAGALREGARKHKTVVLLVRNGHMVRETRPYDTAPQIDLGPADGPDMAISLRTDQLRPSLERLRAGDILELAVLDARALSPDAELLHGGVIRVDRGDGEQHYIAGMVMDSADLATLAAVPVTGAPRAIESDVAEPGPPAGAQPEAPAGHTLPAGLAAVEMDDGRPDRRKARAPNLPASLKAVDMEPQRMALDAAIERARFFTDPADPVLRGILVDDGRVVACDGNHLVEIAVDDRGPRRVVDAAGRPTDVDYPDPDELLPVDDPLAVIDPAPLATADRILRRTTCNPVELEIRRGEVRVAGELLQGARVTDRSAEGKWCLSLHRLRPALLGATTGRILLGTPVAPVVIEGAGERHVIRPADAPCVICPAPGSAEAPESEPVESPALGPSEGELAASLGERVARYEAADDRTRAQLFAELTEALAAFARVFGRRLATIQRPLAVEPEIARGDAGTRAQLAQFPAGVPLQRVADPAALLRRGWCLDGDRLLPRDDYLSGDLWARLDRLAEVPAAHRDVVDAQREALEAAIGTVEYPKIADRVSLRDGWIPLDVIGAYLGTLRNGAPLRIERRDGLVQFAAPETGQDLVYERTASLANTSPLRHAIGYINHDEQVFKPKVQKRLKEDIQEKRREIAAELEMRFRAFLATRTDLQDRVADAYRRAHRGFVPRTYPGAPLDLARWGASVEPHPHQNAGARRAVDQRGMVAAYGVGVGKTFTACATVALARQDIGTRRPVILVPNSLVSKWQRDIRKALPDFAVVTIGEKSWRGRGGELRFGPDEKAEREAKWKRFAAGLYDLALVTPAAFLRTGISSDEFEVLAAGATELQRTVRLAQRTARSRTSPTARQAAVLAQGVRAFLAEMMELPEKWEADDVRWSELGVDLLIVDEAQNYKGLHSPENREGSIPRFMGQSAPSKRAWNLDARARDVRRRGGFVVLLSATPAKNSPLELYNLWSYVNGELWRDHGIHDPEAFISRFCRIDMRLVIDATMEAAMKPAVTGFQRLDELKAILLRWGEFIQPADIGLVVPEPTVELVEVDMDDGQEAKYSRYVREIEAALSDPDSRHKVLGLLARMALVAVHAGMDLGFSYRTAGESDEDPSSPKFEAIADYVLANMTCGHIVFLQAIAGHRWLHDTLVRRGVPANRIGILNGELATSSDARQRIADRFNAGKLDVVIANSIAYEGLDLQVRTCAIHHADLPWEPATLNQRNGRGVRQGNTLGTVALRYYFAKRSMDGLRFNLIQGKQSWMGALLEGSDAIANPGADLELGPDEILLLISRTPEQTAKRLEALRAAAEEKRRRDEQERVVKLIEQGASLLRNARAVEARGDVERARNLRAEASEALDLVERVDPSVWPWRELLRAARAAGADEILDMVGSPPLFPGAWVRWLKEWHEVGRFRFEGAVRKVQLRKAGAATWTAYETKGVVEELRAEDISAERPAGVADDWRQHYSFTGAAEAMRNPRRGWPALGWKWANPRWLEAAWAAVGPQLEAAVAKIRERLWDSKYGAPETRFPFDAGGLVHIQTRDGPPPAGARLLPPTAEGYARWLQLSVGEHFKSLITRDAATQWWWGLALPRGMQRRLKTNPGRPPTKARKRRIAELAAHAIGQRTIAHDRWRGLDEFELATINHDLDWPMTGPEVAHANRAARMAFDVWTQKSEVPLMRVNPRGTVAMRLPPDTPVDSHFVLGLDIHGAVAFLEPAAGAREAQRIEKEVDGDLPVVLVVRVDNSARKPGGRRCAPGRTMVGDPGALKQGAGVLLVVDSADRLCELRPARNLQSAYKMQARVPETYPRVVIGEVRHRYVVAGAGGP